MRSLLKKTLLMGILLSGFLFSSQTIMAESETFNIINKSKSSCFYISFYSGEEVKVDASDKKFTINCSESFNGSVIMNYSLFHVDIFFQNGKFSYMVPCSSEVAVSCQGNDIYIDDSIVPLSERKTITINNLSKKSFKFKGFSTSTSSDAAVKLISRPKIISAGQTEEVMIEYSNLSQQTEGKISYAYGSLGFTIKMNIFPSFLGKSAIDCSVDSLLLPIKVTSSSYGDGIVTISDNNPDQPAVSNTFTIVNKTDRNFLFKGFESYVGDVNLTNYNIGIPKDGIKKFTIAYPKPAPDQQHHPAFTISYTSGFTSCLMQFIVDGQKIFFKENIFPPIPIAIKLDENGSIVISSTK